MTKKLRRRLRLPDGDRAERAPIDLGTLAGGKGQCEKGGLPPGSDRAHVGFDSGVAAVKAVLAQALEDLRGANRDTFQQPDNLRFEGIEFAGALPGFARPEVLLAQPVGHGARIEGQGAGNLRGVEPLVVMQVFDLAKAVIINHDNTSQMRANTALMSTGSSSSASRRKQVGAPGVCAEG